MNRDRASTDGGEAAAALDVERAGDSPPDPPTRNGVDRELPELLDGVESASTAYLVRAGLAAGSGRPVGERLVGALEDEVTVVGSTLDAGFDPSKPELDVLIETDHARSAIASSLASVGPVEGVVVADVTASVERVLGDDGDDQSTDANDVFNDLKDEVRQEGYGTVVDELEDVSFPGGPDPDEEVDLEAAAGVELLDEEPEPIDLEEDDGTLDLDGEDERTTRELLGEDGRSDPDVRAPDEQAIEEAIEEVELDAGSGGSDGGDGPGVSSTPDASADEVAVPRPREDPPEDDMDAFVARLVAALESGSVDEQRRTELREALGIESTHGLDVRVEYLQKRVDNLAAYTDAWEAFLSEQGSGQEFMESVREEVATIEDRLGDLEGDGGAGDAAGLADVEERLDAVESTLTDVEERQDDDVARLDTRIDSVESRLSGRLDALEDAVGTIQGKVTSLLQWREQVGGGPGSGK